MEEISSLPASRVAWLTPDDRNSPEHRRGSRATKAKSAIARPEGLDGSDGDLGDLGDMVAPAPREKHQLDELA